MPVQGTWDEVRCKGYGVGKRHRLSYKQRVWMSVHFVRAPPPKFQNSSVEGKFRVVVQVMISYYAHLLLWP